MWLRQDARELENEICEADDSIEIRALVHELVDTRFLIRSVEGDIAELRYSLLSDIPPLRALTRQIYDFRGKLSRDIGEPENDRPGEFWA